MQRNGKSNIREKVMLAFKDNVIATVEMSNLWKKLKIDNSIDPHITDCMSEVTVVKE